MRDNSNNKDLDKLFQSRLRNDSPADNNWNVPPSNIFENAVAALEEEKPEKKKRYWLPIVFVSLILAGIMFTVVKNSRMIHKLDDKIEILNKQQSQNKVFVNTGNKVEEANILQSQVQSNLGRLSQPQFSGTESSRRELNQTKNTVGESIAKITELEISDNVKLENVKADLRVASNLETAPPITSSYKGEKLNTENGITQAKKSVLSEINDDPNVEDDAFDSTFYYKDRSELNDLHKMHADNFSVVNSDISGSNNIQETNLLNVNPPINVSEAIKNNLTESPTLNVLFPLETNAIALMNENEKVLPNFIGNAPSFIPPNSISKNNPFSVYLFAGSHFSSIKIDGPVDGSLKDYDKNYLCYQIGAGLNHKLNDRLSLNYSLKYKNILIESIHEVKIPYLDGDSFDNGQGDMIYSCEMSVETPTGEHSEHNVLIMEVEEDDIPIDDGNIIDFNTEIEQNIRIGGISSSVNYVPLKLGKFDIVLNGGVGANYVFSGKQDMNTKVLFKVGGTQFTADSQRSGLTFNGNRFYLSGFAGIGATYNLSERLSISLDNNFERSLTSIGNESRLKINSINSNLRIGFRF